MEETEVEAGSSAAGSQVVQGKEIMFFHWLPHWVITVRGLLMGANRS